VAVLIAAVLAAILVALAGMAREAEAAFPNTNGKIFFYRNGDVWAMNPNNANDATKLTTDYNAEANPAVSPDGSRVAYEFLRGIWVMNVDGSGKRQLTDGATTDEDPAFSADGTKIAFSGALICPNTMGKDIWVMNASDGSQK
jgi:Tol biopolymer transport system component